MSPAGGTAPRVLLVEDDPDVRLICADFLGQAGHDVVLAADGREALALAENERFDAVLSDIMMPGLDGLGLLRAIRSRDLDVPIILMTGNPALETAVQAVEHGAFRYLLKPIDARTLLDTVTFAVRVCRLSRLKREALNKLGSDAPPAGDRIGLETTFERALAGLRLVAQPIVHWTERRVIGYEVLARTSEPSLMNPAAFFSTAEQLGRLAELGRAVRLRAARLLDRPDRPELLFLNLHPAELLDDELYAPLSPLSAHAGRVMLEITERASLEEIAGVPDRVRALRTLGFRIAVDDLGAGYSGLTTFAALEPEAAKLDMTLVRNIDQEPVKQKLVRSMTALCAEMGLLLIAEGVETASERDTIAGLGCELLQGYLFSRPAEPFPTVNW